MAALATKNNYQRGNVHEKIMTAMSVVKFCSLLFKVFMMTINNKNEIKLSIDNKGFLGLYQQVPKNFRTCSETPLHCSPHSLRNKAHHLLAIYFF